MTVEDAVARIIESPRHAEVRPPEMTRRRVVGQTAAMATNTPEGPTGTTESPRRMSRIEREKRRHRWENVGLLLVALGVAALVFIAIAVGTH